MIYLITSGCIQRVPVALAAEPYTLGLLAGQPACTISPSG
jgi:hypothetical protein